jgi:hypothetical protein
LIRPEDLQDWAVKMSVEEMVVVVRRGVPFWRRERVPVLGG